MKYIIIAVLVVIMLELLIEAIRDIVLRPSNEKYEECYNCQSGFCMEKPGSERCKEILKKIEEWKRRKGEYEN